METQKYIDAVREISTIERPHHSVSRVSNVLLFREYLRRLRLWKFYFGEAGELNIIDKSNHNLLTYLSGEDGYDNTLHMKLLLQIYVTRELTLADRVHLKEFLRI